MNDIKLLGISGSLRAGSFNTKLMHEGARLLKPAEFTQADIKMPLYDGDAEAAEGQPGQAHAFYKAISDADAVLISTPEYNGQMPGVLKNALDWVSRIKPSAFLWKPTAIVSAAAGRGGGVLAQQNLQLGIAPLRPLLVPGPGVMVAGAMKEFDDAGRLTNERYETALKDLMDGLAELAAFSKSRS